MKLKNGANTVRVITRPYQFDVWLGFKPSEKIPTDRSPYGERLNSSIFHGKDPLMEAPWNLERPSRRWLVGVIDRQTSSYKVLDISSTIFKKIQNLNKIKGDIGGYDITIMRDDQQSAANFYDVIPGDKEPLSAADLEIKENVDLEDLQRRVTPPTYEQVKDRLNKILEIWGVSPSTVAKGGDSVKATTTSSQSDDDGDMDFPTAKE
jgi:hypothetical protein